MTQQLTVCFAALSCLLMWQCVACVVVLLQVGFCPLGPAALSLRMVHTLFTLKGDGRPDWHLRAAVLLATWVAACATQVRGVSVNLRTA
jgi:hypothetical protein